MVHSALLNVMVKAARKAARGLIRDFGEVEKLQVSMKGPANFVSAADKRAEETLKQELLTARPGYSFVGEEGGKTEGSDTSHTWFVDPLDGTTNFLHGIPQFAISIGLERDGVLVAGLVLNPVSDELFLAERGKGAFLNDKRIRVAARKNMGEAVLSCGLAALWTRRPRIVPQGIQPDPGQGRGAAPLRRRRRSILPLSRPAASTSIGSAISRPGTWRRARLIVREAGGFVTDLDDKDEMFTKGHIAAGNPILHGELLKILKEAAKS